MGRKTTAQLEKEVVKQKKKWLKVSNDPSKYPKAVIIKEFKKWHRLMEELQKRYDKE